jgi:hypothetical protein
MPPTTSPNPCLTYAGCNPVTGPYYTSSTCSEPSGYSSAAFDSTIPTNLVNSASFLWAGNTLINTTQVAVVRGRVLQAPGGTAIAGATVTILNHPESTTPTGGAVTTRSDGWYDIPVNGGVLLPFRYRQRASLRCSGTCRRSGTSTPRCRHLDDGERQQFQDDHPAGVSPFGHGPRLEMLNAAA